MIACYHVELWWFKLTPKLININMLTAEHLAQPLCLNTAWGSRSHGSRLQLHCLSSPIFSILFIYFRCSQPLTSKPMADIFYILTSTKNQTSSCCFTCGWAEHVAAAQWEGAAIFRSRKTKRGAFCLLLKRQHVFAVFLPSGLQRLPLMEKWISPISSTVHSFEYDTDAKW